MSQRWDQGETQLLSAISCANQHPQVKWTQVQQNYHAWRKTSTETDVSKQEDHVHRKNKQAEIYTGLQILNCLDIYILH